MRSAGSLNSDSLVMGLILQYKANVPIRADRRAPSYRYSYEAAGSFFLQEMATVPGHPRDPTAPFSVRGLVDQGLT